MAQSKTVVASREYGLGTECKVIVRLYQPEQTLDHPDYSCTFDIHGLSKPYQSYAIGEDALQALLLALAKVGAALYSSEEYRSGTLRWYESADLGLPVPDGFEVSA